MRKKLLFLVAAILLLALAACGGGGESSEGNASNTSNETEGAENEAAPAADGDSITFATTSEAGNLNPMMLPTVSDTYVTHMIYDSLVIPDEELKMVGSLAKDWDVSEDGKTYTFYLEEGVTWHDGEPFTAEDVEFTFTALADPRDRKSTRLNSSHVAIS